MRISLDDDALVPGPLGSSDWIHFGIRLVHHRTVHWRSWWISSTLLTTLPLSRWAFLVLLRKVRAGHEYLQHGTETFGPNFTKATISSTLLHIWLSLRHTGKDLGFIRTLRRHAYAFSPLFWLRCQQATFTKIRICPFLSVGEVTLGIWFSTDWNEMFRSHGLREEQSSERVWVF